MASSGSSAAIGSIEKSKPAPPVAIPIGIPSSPIMTGEFINISDSIGPGRA